MRQARWRGLAPATVDRCRPNLTLNCILLPHLPAILTCSDRFVSVSSRDSVSFALVCREYQALECDVE